MHILERHDHPEIGCITVRSSGLTSPDAQLSAHGDAVMEDLQTGAPVERAWLVWHAMIGLGVGLLFIPRDAPPIFFILAFLISSLAVIVGVQFRKKLSIILGLLGLAGASLVRAAVIWRAPSLGAGSQLVATFVWVMLAVGAIMEAYSVRNRGIS